MLSVRHLIDATELTEDDVYQILDTARSMAEVNKRAIKKLPTLRGKTIVTLFLEPSTRTKNSFDIAAKRLSADTVAVSGSASAVVKGESLEDTVRTLDAMNIDMIIIRHRYAGSPVQITRVSDSVVVNAGDGKHQHPTQGLLDLYSLRENFGHLEGLKVGIVGDAAHSRVVGSLAPLLKTVGAHPILIGPQSYMPARPDVLGATYESHFDDVIGELDAVYMLRVQNERLEGASIPSTREYHRLFGLDMRRLKLMKEGAVVMHPGPMNRGVEISAEVADSSQSLILDQVAAGVSVRMAVMYLLLGGESYGTAS